MNEEEMALLRRLVGAMIPAAPAEGLPGADDDEVIARLIGKSASRLTRLQDSLHDLAGDAGGASELLALDDAGFMTWFDSWASRWPGDTHPLFDMLAPLLAQAYYEDPRVQQAHGRRPGPPFPEGYVVIQGDWSLLDEVRERPPMYRR